MSEQLRAYVDKVVNPIRAFGARKARFREELLAHLAELLRECDGNQEEAMRRFGEPGLIRQELQKSVPWIERVAAMDLFPDATFTRLYDTNPRPGEAPLRYGIRMAAWVAAAQLLLMLGTIAVCTLIRGENLEQIIYLGRPVYFAVPLVLVSFLSLAPLLAFGVAPGRTLRQVLARGCCVALWMILLMGGFVQLERLAGVMTLNLQQFVELAAILCLGPCGIYLAYRLNRLEIARQERWERMAT